MLLRSSSTPVLGSLLSSFSETPNSRRFSNSEAPNIATPEHGSSSILSHGCSKISYNKHGGPAQHLTASLYNNSSSISPSVSEVLSGNSQVGGGFRRAQSEGNLEALAGASSSYMIDEFNFKIPTKKLARKPPHCSTLEAIPSFSFHNCSRTGEEDEDESQEEEEEEEEEEQDLDGQMIENDYGTFCDYACVENHRTSNYAARGFELSSGFKNEGNVEMYLAKGLGVPDFNFVDIGGHINGGNGGGTGFRPVDFGDSHGLNMEQHYKKMLDENPGNPLCLRNYAQFLHQTKKDLKSAEEYYCRAILADPTDGEVLSQYGKLVWELYRDSDRARDYFERAVQAAGQDSHVQAAYACFLWDTADEEEDEDCQRGSDCIV